MEVITLQETIGQISQAYTALEVAKNDFKDVTESALDAYREAEPNLTDIDMKNIKKIAQALAKGKQKTLSGEADSLKELMDAIK
jgi:hypothetical protein